MSDLASLKRLFDFTDEDLAVNRGGNLSARQYRHYHHMRLANAVNRWASILTFVLFLISLVIFIGISLAYANQLGPLTLVVIGVWLALVYVMTRIIPMMAKVIIRQSTTNDTHWGNRLFGEVDPKSIGVLQATGRLSFPTDGEHRYVMLGDLELTNDAAADKDNRLWKLQTERTYTIYYLPDPLWIVAIEPA